MPLHTFLLSISPPLLFSSAGLARILSTRPGVTPGVAWIWPLACWALSSGGRRNPAKYSALKQGSNACPALPLCRDLLPLQSPRGPCPSARAPASAAKYFPLGSFLIRKKKMTFGPTLLCKVCAFRISFQSLKYQWFALFGQRLWSSCWKRKHSQAAFPQTPKLFNFLGRPFRGIKGKKIKEGNRFPGQA